MNFLELREVKFRHVSCASGTRSFYGEGYTTNRFSRIANLLANWDNSTFVSKTTTFDERMGLDRGGGNMLLDCGTFQPIEANPDCIITNPWKCITLNSVGLSGPGAERLLNEGRWQWIAEHTTEPFRISFMPAAEEQSEQEDQTRKFVDLFLDGMTYPAVKEKFGLEINLSCPNVKSRQSKMIAGSHKILDITSELSIPTVVKLNLLASQESAYEIASHDACDALCLTNAILWGELADEINWYRLFGTNVSPLAHLGGGALSGPPLLIPNGTWISKFRDTYGIDLPIIGGGGVFSKKDAIWMLKMGATGISLGTVAMYRSWRVQRIIKAVNQYCLSH